MQVRRTCAGGLLKKGAVIFTLTGAYCYPWPRHTGPPDIAPGRAAHFVDCGELSAGLVWVAPLAGPGIGSPSRQAMPPGVMVLGVFNHLRTWVDSSPIRLTRLLGSWPLDASAFAPAVAHLSPDRGRVPCSWCCLASLVTFSGRQSPPLSCHRWPGSCARLASRNALALRAAADSSLHPLSYSRFERACLFLFWGVSPATQTRCPVLVGMASVPAKKNE